MQRTANPIAISVAPAARVIGKQYYDLPGSIEFIGRLRRESVVDGFEFQNLAEWNGNIPPRDEREKRFAAWNASQKHTTDEIATLVEETGLPILSVHANRDVGICLCSDEEREINEGRRLIHESLSLADKIGASVCVFHLWDTWHKAFEPSFLQNVFREIVPLYPRVRASVENVPTHLDGFTPFDLVRRFEWITLDLRWAAMYDELDKFEAVKEQIANVHLRGRLEGSRWVLDDSPFGFYEALDTIRGEWGYSGLLTMEPGGLKDGDWESLLASMLSLKDRGYPTPSQPPAALISMPLPQE